MMASVYGVRWVKEHIHPRDSREGLTIVLRAYIGQLLRFDPRAR